MEPCELGSKISAVSGFVGHLAYGEKAMVRTAFLVLRDLFRQELALLTITSK